MNYAALKLDPFIAPKFEKEMILRTISNERPLKQSK